MVTAMYHECTQDVLVSENVFRVLQNAERDTFCLNRCMLLLGNILVSMLSYTKI